MSWDAFGGWLDTHVKALNAAFGLGGGVGLMKFIRHIPAPAVNKKWSGSVFDWLQDIASNNDRIGERVAADGSLIRIEQPKIEPKKEPTQ